LKNASASHLELTLTKAEKDRLDKALKVLANAASYGIYAEMNPQESDEKDLGCLPRHRFWGHLKCRVVHPDVPGAYCFSSSRILNYWRCTF